MESLGFSPQNHSRFLSELHTHVHMFAVTTTPTSLSSSATRSLKNNKASSLSKRAKCSSIVVSSSPSSSGKNKMMDEKFDRREMLKNALVASVGVVAATPMPVSSFVWFYRSVTFLCTLLSSVSIIKRRRRKPDAKARLWV